MRPSQDFSAPQTHSVISTQRTILLYSYILSPCLYSLESNIIPIDRWVSKNLKGKYMQRHENRNTKQPDRGKQAAQHCHPSNALDRTSGSKFLDPGRVGANSSTQCRTYNTHKSGKPEKSETQKKTLPSILFLRIAGILPIAINGIWMSCGERVIPSNQSIALTPGTQPSQYILTCDMNKYIL